MLYDLVSLRNSLRERTLPDDAVKALTDLKNSIAAIKTTVDNISTNHTQYIDSIIAHYDALIKQAQLPVEQNKAIIAELDESINKIAHELYNENYVMEQHELTDNVVTADFVREKRSLIINEDTEHIIKQKILLYTNWRYPALELGCRDGEWTQYMVASDPLYIMDKFPEFLENTGSKFPNLYNNRLRKYLIKNYNLSALPQNQFSFVFSFGYFNHLSLDTITQYLKQIYNLLRPGGVFLFTYNDGDTLAGAGMAEHRAQTFIPKSILVPTCLGSGFEVLGELQPQNNISLLEIKKPGNLKTVKSHQVLGEIKRREN